MPIFSIFAGLIYIIPTSYKRTIMKQFFLLAAFFSCFALANVQAQDYSCSKTAASSALANQATASKVAALDASIEQRIDQETGKAVYVRKKVCSTTGKVSYTEVEYCSKSGKFVNLSPREQHCVKSKARCADKGARATKVSTAGKVNCTPAQKAACAKAGAEGKAAGNASAGNVKLVRNQ